MPGYDLQKGMQCFCNLLTGGHGDAKSCKVLCDKGAGCTEFSISSRLDCHYGKSANCWCLKHPAANIANYCKSNHGWNQHGCKDGSCKSYFVRPALPRYDLEKGIQCHYNYLTEGIFDAKSCKAFCDKRASS